MIRAQHALLVALGVAMMLWGFCGCSTAHTPLEERAVLALLDAWDEKGLPEPLASCRLEAFRIEHPATLEAFQRTCSAPGMDPALLHAWACLRTRYEAPRARSITYPAAVLRPDLAEEHWGAAAVHELAHAAYSCSGLGTQLNPYDAGHTDPREWQAVGGAESVQARAMELLGE